MISARCSNIETVDLYGVSPLEQSAAIDAMIETQGDFPIVLVGGVVACVSDIDADAIADQVARTVKCSRCGSAGANGQVEPPETCWRLWVRRWRLLLASTPRGRRVGLSTRSTESRLECGQLAVVFSSLAWKSSPESERRLWRKTGSSPRIPVQACFPSNIPHIALRSDSDSGRPTRLPRKPWRPER